MSADSLAEQHVRELTAGWVRKAREALRVDQEGWPEATDDERLLDERAAAGTPPAGVAWFTPPDVWHAVDEGMLEVNLWHGTTANAAPGDELLDDVLGVLEKHGLTARFDEGRIEIDAHWHRRIAP